MHFINSMECQCTTGDFDDSFNFTFAAIGLDATESHIATAASDIFLSSMFIRSIGVKNTLCFEFISMLSQANSKSTDSPIAMTQNYVCPLFVCCCTIYDIQQAKCTYTYHLVQNFYFFFTLLFFESEQKRKRRNFQSLQ